MYQAVQALDANQTNQENLGNNEAVNNSCGQRFSMVAQRYGLNKIDIWYPMVGDMVWTPFSYYGFNADWQISSNTSFVGDSQWLGQQLYPPLAMILLAASHYAYHRYVNQGKENPPAYPASDVMALMTSACCGIYAWDRAQALGVNLAQSWGLSSGAAGYAASAFTGVIPGPVQYSVGKVFRLCVQDKEWTHYEKDPEYGKKLLKELGVSASIGAIPGAAWQLIFNASSIGGFGPLATTLFVMSGVGCVNWATVNASEQVLEKGCFQAASDCLGWFAPCGVEPVVEEIPQETIDDQEQLVKAPFTRLVDYLRGHSAADEAPDLDCEMQPVNAVGGLSYGSAGVGV